MRHEPMKILFPVDESPYSAFAEQALIEQAKSQNAEVLVLHVMDVLANLSMYDSYGTSDEIKRIEEDRELQANAFVKQAAKSISAAGIPTATRVERGDPKSAVVEIAKQWGAELIVIGSHGRKGVEHFFLGSVSEAVARYAPCSVLIVRGRKPLDKTDITQTHDKCAHPSCT
jgi:nucleotide-binding universal stress UspA family protein